MFGAPRTWMEPGGCLGTMPPGARLIKPKTSWCIKGRLSWNDPHVSGKLYGSCKALISDLHTVDLHSPLCSLPGFWKLEYCRNSMQENRFAPSALTCKRATTVARAWGQLPRMSMCTCLISWRQLGAWKERVVGLETALSRSLVLFQAFFASLGHALQPTEQLSCFKPKINNKHTFHPV